MMKVTHPSFSDQSEVEAKLWDDLFIMSDYSLDIDSPYPIPEKKSKDDVSKRLDYPKNKIRYRHYGKKIELLIEEACKLKNEEDKEAAVIHIGKIMKSFFGMWNKESIDNNVIVENIKELSNNKLTIDVEKVKELNLFHKVTRERGSKSYHSKSIITNLIDPLEKEGCNEFIQNYWRKKLKRRGNTSRCKKRSSPNFVCCSIN